MPNGDAKLFDFGVARVRQKHGERDFDPGVLGALTPAYSSMQVIGGEEPVAKLERVTSEGRERVA